MEFGLSVNNEPGIPAEIQDVTGIISHHNGGMKQSDTKLIDKLTPVSVELQEPLRSPALLFGMFGCEEYIALSLCRVLGQPSASGNTDAVIPAGWRAQGK
jgi:hypothetical protein